MRPEAAEAASTGSAFHVEHPGEATTSGRWGRWRNSVDQAPRALFAGEESADPTGDAASALGSETLAEPSAPGILARPEWVPDGAATGAAAEAWREANAPSSQTARAVATDLAGVSPAGSGRETTERAFVAVDGSEGDAAPGHTAETPATGSDGSAATRGQDAAPGVLGAAHGELEADLPSMAAVHGPAANEPSSPSAGTTGGAAAVEGVAPAASRPRLVDVLNGPARSTEESQGAESLASAAPQPPHSTGERSSGAGSIDLSADASSGATSSVDAVRQ